MVRKPRKKPERAKEEPSTIKASDVLLRQACKGLDDALAALLIDFTDRPAELAMPDEKKWNAWRKAEAQRRVDQWNQWHRVGTQHRLKTSDVEAIARVIEDISQVLYKIQPTSLIQGYIEASDHSKQLVKEKRRAAYWATAEAIPEWCEKCIGEDTAQRRRSKARIAYKLTQQLQTIDPEAFAGLAVDAVQRVLSQLKTSGRSPSAVLVQIAATCAAWPEATQRLIDNSK